MMNFDKYAMVLIDLQAGIFEGRGGDHHVAADARLDALCKRLASLAQRWTDDGRPLVLVQHNGVEGHRLAAGTPGWALRPELASLPSDIVVKSDCDSFLDTRLLAVLEALDAKGIVLGGCMTEYCINTTCRSAVSHGYDVVLLADGHGTVDAAFTAEQIVARYNDLLDGYGAGDRRVQVLPVQDLYSPQEPSERSPAQAG